MALLVWLMAQPVWAGWPEGVPGAEAGRMVREAMAAAGEAAAGEVAAGEVAVARFADPVRGFPPCAGDPVVTPRGGSWATAELRCASPAWVRAIRTGAEPVAQVALRDAGAVADPMLARSMVVTLVRGVAKGAVIAAGDVVLRQMSGRGVSGIFSDPAEVVGRRARGYLGAGQPVLLRQLQPAWLVETGNPLALTAAAGGLQVSAPAEALEDGRLGDVIRVLNLSSGREVKAVVTGANIVAAQTNMR